MRDRLQRGVNRLLFGERDDPYVVLSQLTRQLRQTGEPGLTLPAVAATITRALKLPYAAIELSDGDAGRTVAASGRASMETESWPVSYTHLGSNSPP